jgi:hypothetical protein
VVSKCLAVNTKTRETHLAVHNVLNNIPVLLISGYTFSFSEIRKYEAPTGE